jgi:sulfur carrier protein
VKHAVSGGAVAATIVVNGAARALVHGQTVADLVRDLALEGKRIAVELNGEIVPRSRYRETGLSSGDRLEIVGAVGGG